MLFTLVYNALVAVVDMAVLATVRSRGSVLRATVGIVAVGVASLVAAVAVETDGFGAMRLLAWGLFVHVPCVLLLIAGLLFRQRPAAAVVAALAAVAMIAVAVDAFLIEPTALEVTHHRIESPKLKAPLKIVVLADLQTDAVGPYERQVIERALAETPDLILLAGDYLQLHDSSKWPAQRDALRQLLGELDFKAPLGVYAVQGNVDGANWRELFAGFPVTAVSETTSFDQARDDLRITGLAMADSFDASVTIPPSERFHIVLGHCPNFSLGDVEADLLIAGHTHGGQVRLPGIGPLVTLSRVRRSWAAGMTDIGRGRQLLVSRGIGMERGRAPRLRFLCRPELVVLELAPR